MKHVKKTGRRFVLGFVLLLVCIAIPKLGETQAASSYTNAKEFYESVSKYHAEAYDGHVYYATYAKKASSSTNKMYQTVGFDVTMEGGGQSVSFGVKREGSMQTVAVTPSGNYEYTLYKISRKRLNELAMASNPTAAAVVLDSSVIRVRLDAIVTTKQYGELHGNVTETGSGGLLPWGKVYHVNRASDLARLRDSFNGHSFDSYRNIQCPLFNYQLSVNYNLNGGTVSNGYESRNDLLYQNDGMVITKSRILNPMQLVNQNTIGLTKTGYHTVAGKEWINQSNGRYHDHSISYMPSDIYPAIAQGDHGVTMKANWQPNTYTITYDANGGTGYMHTTAMTYDETKALRKNGYTRKGYYFTGWNTKRDGSGVAYADQEGVCNLTTEQNGNVTLYAQWESLVFTITTDKQGGIGGTDAFYEKYATGWYLNYAGTNSTQSITIPQRIGYEFLGYHMSIWGMGDMIVNNVGSIDVNPAFFLHDSRVYANWKAKEYTITFDKQGGYGGTDSAKVIYNEELPTADAPVKTGYSFKGYYTEPQGKGEMYYNEFMAATTRYLVDGDMTLYAYWVDDVAPKVYLNSNYEEWTNRDIILGAVAYDHGSGLASLTLYCGDTKILDTTEAVDPDKPVKMVLTHTNEPEGVIRYRAVAVDKAGNTAEVFKTIYSDTTAPKGTVTYEYFDGQNVEIEVFVDDWKVE